MPNAVITFALTIAHLSPEAVLRQEFGKPMDIWSVGCVVVEMATGKVSYIHIYIYIYPPTIMPMYLLNILSEVYCNLQVPCHYQWLLCCGWVLVILCTLLSTT